MADKAIPVSQPQNREWAIRANRWVYSISTHWMLGFSLIYGLFVALPFLAPVFMKLGWELPGRAIYMVYSFLCHQLPQRSFFLFGSQFTHPTAEILTVWPSDSIMQLRQFIGTAEMGWKVAWSDRMVSMYTSILLFAWIWYPLRKRLPHLGWQGFVLFLLPMAIDGFSHVISDLAGMGQGFRDSNQWLAALTNNAFAPTFYSGDAWGSFNSIIRLATGILFGAGLIWFCFPYVNDYFLSMKELIQYKFGRAGLHL